MVGWTAEQEAEHAARMETPWMLLWSSDRPADHALALAWLGRRMGEMFWRFEIAMRVDALAAQLSPETVGKGRKQG
jgi:hypothetical protein